MASVEPMSKKQAQFFAGLILICTITAALVLVVDYTIKGAILEQTLRLRAEIEGWQRGQKPAPAGSNGSHHDPSDYVAYPADLVDSRATGVEETGHHVSGNRAGKATHARTARPPRANGTGPVPGSSIESES